MPDSAPLTSIVPQVTTGAFPSSRKIYVTGKRHGDVNVAMRLPEMFGAPSPY